MGEDPPRQVRAFLADALRAGVFSSAVALRGTIEKVDWVGAAGWAQEGVLAGVSTRFDFASLTKPLVATLAVALDAAGILPLSTRIGDAWPRAHRALAGKPLADLLRHRSGLEAWTPLYARCRSLAEVEELLAGGGSSGDLLGARAGTYSDLGYILWGRTVERSLGQNLEALLREKVFAPLGLSSLAASPGPRPDVAASRMGTGQEVRLAARQGVAIGDLGPPSLGCPQDGNGRFLLSLGAPVSGHAGLFGGARDLWRLGAEWLAPERVLKAEGVAAALTGGGSFALGWWRRTLRGSGGRALSAKAFGHPGFAGNSVWIDPQPRRIFVLLGSRLDPTLEVNRWRRRFHRLAAVAGASD